MVKLKKDVIINDTEIKLKEPIKVENLTSDLESDFKDFEKSVAEFQPETENENNVSDITPQKVEVTLEQKIKIKMFVGFCCFLLTGLNVFIFNKIRSTKVPYEKMILNSAEIESLTPYMESTEVLNFIDKLPTWLIGVLHVEYMYFQKHAEFVEEYKIIKPKKEIKKGKENE